MSNDISVCGQNRLTIPSNGCSDCSAYEYRIKLLEDWVEAFEAQGYSALANKPSINGVTVSGDKDLSDYNINSISDATIEALSTECVDPACASSLVCVGTTCCAKTACDESGESDESEIVAEIA